MGILILLLIPRYLVVPVLFDPAVRTRTTVDIRTNDSPIPTMGLSLLNAADTASGVGAIEVVVVTSPYAVAFRLCQLADWTGPGVGAVAVVLPSAEIVRTALLRAADRASADVTAVFIAP